MADNERNASEDDNESQNVHASVIPANEGTSLVDPIWFDSKLKNILVVHSEIKYIETIHFSISGDNSDVESASVSDCLPNELANQLTDGVANMMSSNATVQEELTIKSEPTLLMTPCSSNLNELYNLLNSHVIEEVDDEMTIIYGSKGFGLPYKTTDENLIKRENDPISGNMAFTQTVSKLVFMIQKLQIHVSIYLLF